MAGWSGLLSWLSKMMDSEKGYGPPTSDKAENLVALSGPREEKQLERKETQSKGWRTA